MRVALISYEFPPETLGGIGTYAGHAVRMLAARGHAVTVFTCTTGAEREESWHGARVIRLMCLDRQAFNLPAVERLAAEHKRLPFDVAEVPDLYAEGRGLRAALPDLPIVLRAHTPLYIPWEIDFNALSPTGRLLSATRRAIGGITHLRPPSSIWREVRRRQSFPCNYDPLSDQERQVAIDADVVAPPSQRLAQRLRDDWRLPKDRVQVLPYPHFPSPKLLALPPPSGGKVIGFHGGVRRFKGVHILIAAMPLVLQRHPDARLVLAGASGSSSVPDYSLTGWLKDQMLRWQDTVTWLRPQIAALGDRVTLSGFVRPENLHEHLSACDVCVFPSLFDNFPSACLEAMSAARPIVATRSGGMEEMLGEEDAGLLVPPGDAPALAAALCRMLDDAALRQRLALRARERVLADYAPEVIGPRHEALYAEAIARRRSALGSIPHASTAAH